MAEGAPKKVDMFRRLGQFTAAAAVGVVGLGIFEGGKHAERANSGAPVATPEDETRDRGARDGKPEGPANQIEGVTPNYTLEFAPDALVSVQLGEGLPPNSIVGVYIASSTFRGRYDVPERARSMSSVLETYQSYSPTDTNPVGGLYFETSVREDGTVAIPSWILIEGQRINVGPGVAFGVLVPGGTVRPHMIQQGDIGAGTLRLG